VLPHEQAAEGLIEVGGAKMGESRDRLRGLQKEAYVPPLMETIDEKELLGEDICPRGTQTLYQS
jgi:hypothetical protein